MTARRSRPAKLTPMLEQYLALKRQQPDALLLFRMGDFYETFFDDAQVLADVCQVTLTTRDRNSDHPVPLAGVPHHALDNYLARLLDAGLTVAICEQVEDPAQAKGLVKREIVEVISPGTATAPELIDGASGRFCLAYAPAADPEAPAGWALLDASTGEFRCGGERADLAALCERHPVREAVVPETVSPERIAAWRRQLPNLTVTPVSAAWFHPAFARDVLCRHFGSRDLSPFGLEEERHRPAVAAAGAALHYLTTLSRRRPDQVTGLRLAEPGDRLVLDEETLRNLEVFRTFRGDRGEGTLVHHVDATVTPMGRRLLERRLAEPLTDLAELAAWHRGVAAAVSDRDWRRAVREALAGLGDLERAAVRAAAGRLGPARLRGLGAGLARLAAVADAVRAGGHEQHPATAWLAELPDLSDLARRLLETLADEPPATVKAGEMIRAGVDAALDRARAVAADTRGYLASLQAAERERTGIPTLKVGYNKVFGYYFEVSNRHLDKVPDDYVQRQTLVNAARFHSDALKEAEQTILHAEQTIEERETALYRELLAATGERLAEIRRAAAVMARLDLLFAFAEIAESRGWCRPVCDDSLVLDIRGGRHPVVEALLESDFIPNDTLLDADDQQIVLLTGPNMGGKSTYLRQVALAVLLAQAGAFVPADSARIGVVDRIFTRVGASDNVARGQSTFFAEMSETARILHQMTRRSLVILDEVGRGTATYDGLSLAWAITEYLHHDDGPRPRTVFATHYHELTRLADRLPRLRNHRVEVREWEGRIVFLHTVRPGASDRSYGIHVARLAGVPEPVLRRAEQLLAEMTSQDERFLDVPAPDPGWSVAPENAAAAQLSLFSEPERDVLEQLRELDLDSLSPLDAFLWLVKVRRALDDAGR